MRGERGFIITTEIQQIGKVTHPRITASAIRRTDLRISRVYYEKGQENGEERVKHRAIVV
jgi:hypothetical protein